MMRRAIGRLLLWFIDGARPGGKRSASLTCFQKAIEINQRMLAKDICIREEAAQSVTPSPLPTNRLTPMLTIKRHAAGDHFERIASRVLLASSLVMISCLFVLPLCSTDTAIWLGWFVVADMAVGLGVEIPAFGFVLWRDTRVISAYSSAAPAPTPPSHADTA